MNEHHFALSNTLGGPANFMLRLVLKVDLKSCRATHSAEKISNGIRPELKGSSRLWATVVHTRVTPEVMSIEE